MAAEKFEKSLERLETLVKQLEAGELDLEGSMKAFEEGVVLVRNCEKQLTDAERKVEVLLKDQSGFQTAPYRESDGQSDGPGNGQGDA